MRSRRTAASPILSRPTARAPIATAPIATAPAAAAMTATNATEAAPAELAPVACAPVARARVDKVRGCCVRMISLLDRIWVGVLTTLGRDGPSRPKVVSTPTRPRSRSEIMRTQQPRTLSTRARATGAPATGASSAGAASVAFVAVIAAAAGAMAMGAVAIGALAVGRLRIGDATVRRLRTGELEVDQLRVRRLRSSSGTTGAEPCLALRRHGGDAAATVLAVEFGGLALLAMLTRRIAGTSTTRCGRTCSGRVMPTPGVGGVRSGCAALGGSDGPREPWKWIVRIAFVAARFSCRLASSFRWPGLTRSGPTASSVWYMWLVSPLRSER